MRRRRADAREGMHVVRAAVDVEVELRLEEVERAVVAERAPLRVHHSART